VFVFFPSFIYFHLYIGKQHLFRTWQEGETESEQLASTVRSLWKRHAWETDVKLWKVKCCVWKQQ